MALSKEQADQLAELERLRDAPEDEDQGDDGHVIVLRGARADSFLAQLIGPGAPARKAAPKPAGKPAGKPAPRPAGKPATKPAEEDETEEDETEEDQDEAPPARAPRYFR